MGFTEKFILNVNLYYVLGLTQNTLCVFFYIQFYPENEAWHHWGSIVKNEKLQALNRTWALWSSYAQAHNDYFYHRERQHFISGKIW
jgi:hypothetical protein